MDHDQGGLAPPSVPDIKQPSPPSSDKPPTSARSGKGSVSDTRRMSASKRSGKFPLYHVVTHWDLFLSCWIVVFTIWGKVYLWIPLNNNNVVWFLWFYDNPLMLMSVIFEGKKTIYLDNNKRFFNFAIVKFLNGLWLKGFFFFNLHVNEYLSGIFIKHW